MNAPTDLSVLLLEPSKSLRMALKARCEARGVRVLVAEDVPGALSLVMDERPRAVLTSSELEGMGGLALVAALRACREYRALPSVVLTSGEVPASAVQPDLVLAKDPQLLDRLDEFLDAIGMRVEEGQVATPLDGMKVLLAEDSAVGRSILGQILHVAGAEVTSVPDGAEAVSLGLRETFDLILLDIQMPRLDGNQAASILHDAGVDAPILAITASEGFIDPGDDFQRVLPKPLDREDLIGACREALRA